MKPEGFADCQANGLAGGKPGGAKGSRGGAAGKAKDPIQERKEAQLADEAQVRRLLPSEFVGDQRICVEKRWPKYRIKDELDKALKPLGKQLILCWQLLLPLLFSCRHAACWTCR